VGRDGRPATQGLAAAATLRIATTYARFAVEFSLDRISFGLSALGIVLFQHVSLPTTVTLVKHFEPGGRPFLPYLFFFESNS
jgi:hypothetical protein